MADLKIRGVALSTKKNLQEIAKQNNFKSFNAFLVFVLDQYSSKTIPPQTEQRYVDLVEKALIVIQKNTDEQQKLNAFFEMIGGN